MSMVDKKKVGTPYTGETEGRVLTVGFFILKKEVYMFVIIKAKKKNTWKENLTVVNVQDWEIGSSGKAPALHAGGTEINTRILYLGPNSFFPLF